MKYKDYYEILGVKKDAPQDEIKRVYRKLARKYHPDVSKESDAETKFKEVGEAYEVLKDPEKREAYDQLGADWKAGQDGFQPPPDWQDNFDFGGGGYTQSNAQDYSSFLKTYLVAAGHQGVTIQVVVHTEDFNPKAIMSEQKCQLISKILLTLQTSHSLYKCPSMMSKGSY